MNSHSARRPLSRAFSAWVALLIALIAGRGVLPAMHAGHSSHGAAGAHESHGEHHAHHDHHHHGDQEPDGDPEHDPSDCGTCRDLVLAKYGSPVWTQPGLMVPRLVARLGAPAARAAVPTLTDGSPPSRGPPRLRSV